MSHTVSVLGLLVFVGCADVPESQTPSAITAADDAYSGNSSDLLQPLPIVPVADAPIRSGYYESLGSYSFITIDVASPKDGSDTWLVNLYDHDSSNCANNPSQLWNLAIDGKATIEVRREWTMLVQRRSRHVLRVEPDRSERGDAHPSGGGRHRPRTSDVRLGSRHR